MDHAKFKDMVKGLTGEVLVNKLKDDFVLPIHFRAVKSNLPLITHDPLIELDVLQEEMMDVELPNDTAWKEIQWLGKQVLIFPSTRWDNCSKVTVMWLAYGQSI